MIWPQRYRDRAGSTGRRYNNYL